MGILNILDYPVGLLLYPFHGFHPFLALVGVCVLITCVGMVAYKKLTDQEALKHIQDQIKIRLMEMRLRQHTIGELIRLQNEGLAWNFRYLKTAFLPSLVIFVPMVLLLPSLDARFAYAPARVGTIVPVEVVLSDMKKGMEHEFKLESLPKGLELIEKDGRVGTQNVIGWYLRALENGVYTLKFRYGEKTFEKQVVVSDKIQPLQWEIKPPGLPDTLYSLESSTLEEGAMVQAITVGYKKVYSPFGIFGWYPDWIYSFLIIFLILFFVLRPVMKVH